MNLSPNKQVAFGANYGCEKFNSFQNSRNANPVGTDYGSWTDPNRVWNLTNDAKVNNFDLYLDLNKAIPNINVRLSYDYSDSDNAFIHSGPRIQELLTNTPLTVGAPKPCAAGVTSCFIPLPGCPPHLGAWRADRLRSVRRALSRHGDFPPPLALFPAPGLRQSVSAAETSGNLFETDRHYFCDPRVPVPPDRFD